MVVHRAEAFETLSDPVTPGFLLISFRPSQRPAGEVYRYGHGRVQSVGALVAAMNHILFLNLETFRQAILELLAPAAGETPAGRLRDRRDGLWSPAHGHQLPGGDPPDENRRCGRQRPVRRPRRGPGRLFGGARKARPRRTRDYLGWRPPPSLAIGVLVLVGQAVSPGRGRGRTRRPHPAAGRIRGKRAASHGVPGVPGIHYVRAECVG